MSQVVAVVQRTDTGMYWAGSNLWRESPDDALPFTSKREAFAHFVMTQTNSEFVEFNVVDHAGAEPVR